MSHKVEPKYETWSELDLLIGLIVGEAGSARYPVRLAVAHAVANRVASPCWWGRNWREVILAPKQFQCWYDDAKTSMIASEHLKPSLIWQSARQIAVDVYAHPGATDDPSLGATHYHLDPMPHNSPFPEWAGNMTQTIRIGRYVFYR